MRSDIRLALAAAGLCLATVAGAQSANPSDTSSSGATTLSAPVVMGEIVTLQGTVAAVDAAKRVVTIQGADGGMAVLRAGPEMRNFERIRVGDRVDVRYNESVAVQLLKGGDDIRQRIETQAESQAPAGQRPEVRGVERTTIVADVWEVDREKGTVTLRGPEGRMMRVRVQDPALLRDVSSNDQVVATITESIALSIEPGAAASGGTGAAGTGAGALR